MGAGNFVASKTLEVRLNDGGTRVLAGDKVFVNIGTHATIPSVPGLDAAGPLTNIEALELDYVRSRIQLARCLEGCESYIKSQAHVGWCLVLDCYDGGGNENVRLRRSDSYSTSFRWWPERGSETSQIRSIGQDASVILLTACVETTPHAAPAPSPHAVFIVRRDSKRD